MMEDFSGLALPPLFGGHILEAELEPGGVELGPGDDDMGTGGGELLDAAGQCPGHEQDDEHRRELEREKYAALAKRCKDLEQVNERILGRLHQVQRLTRRLKKERRFLMKTLDSYGDDYRSAQLTILLEDEAGAVLDSTPGADDDRPNGYAGSSPSVPPQPTGGPKKKRHRIPKEKERDTQTEADLATLAETTFTGFPSPNSLSQ
ncbi:TCF3 fusion partner [Denticeps clupeoides]|uniref:INO80 complex subunit F domain-containing protein n=1 Tax=Denticeps clupeoides TaxID=299321 RepID=A0AAY4AE21_9TELE|nr:TCF3 fusion partner [Denticeps clupeoides]XP_028836657.1 TCF3 fusion partner [Denticeps clupeoides]